MLQFFEPTQQLFAAFILGSCTLFAAIVNAVAQTRIAHDARRKSQPVPKPRRVRRWVVLGAAFTLALGWSATVAHDHAQAADGTGANMMGVGMATLLGSRDTRVPPGEDALTVAQLEMHTPITVAHVVGLLDDYDLRAYAIDLRLADEPETWLPVPVGVAAFRSVPRARADALRRAWHQACVYESVLATVSDGASDEVDSAASDSHALRLVRGNAQRARAYAERFAAEEAVVHAVRVVTRGGSASRVAQDSAVARAEIVRHDPGWPMHVPDPAEEGCEVVRVDGTGEITRAARMAAAAGE